VIPLVVVAAPLHFVVVAVVFAKIHYLEQIQVRLIVFLNHEMDTNPVEMKILLEQRQARRRLFAGTR
jgi:hypothetical protein